MGFLSMLIAFIILLIFTTMFTWSSISLEKKHKKWLEDAKRLYKTNLHQSILVRKFQYLKMNINTIWILD